MRMETRLKYHRMVMAILIIVHQLINEVNSLAPQIKKLNVQCDASGMKVDVSFDSPFNGIVFSKGFYNDMNCRYIQEKSDSDSLSFSIPADRCGTSIVRTDAKDSKQYENVIIFQNDPIYQEIWDSARLLSCRYLLERDLPIQEKRVVFKPFIVDMLDVLTVPMADFAGDRHKVDCWMDVTKGRYPNNSPIDGPVKVGENLTLAIYIRDSRKRTDIRVKDCYAYDNEESVNNKSPALLQLSGEDGCPLKPKLMDVWKRTADTGNSDATVLAYSTVTAFKFPEHSNVHLTCNVELCKNQCADRCSLETKGIEGLKESPMGGDEEGGKKKETDSGSDEKGGDDGDDEESDKKKADGDEGGDGSGDVKPSPDSASPSAKRDPKASEGGDGDDDEKESKSTPAPVEDDDDDGDAETSSPKPIMKPESASSTKDDDEDSDESDKTSERGGKSSDSDSDDDDDDDDSTSVRSTSTTITPTPTTTTTSTTTTTTAKPEDDDEEANEDDEETPASPSSSTTTTTTTTTEKPSARSEDGDEDDEEDDDSDSNLKRSVRPSSKVEDKDEDEDKDNDEGGEGNSKSSELKAKKSLKLESTSDDDEDYDDSQSSRGSSTSVSTTTTTPIPKTPLIIVIKPEKLKKKIKEAAPRTRGGRIENRSRQAVRSSSSKLSSSPRSSSSRDSCCSDVTTSRLRTSTTTTKPPSTVKSSGRSVRRSSRFDEPETSSKVSGKRSKSLNRSTSERTKKQIRSSTTPAATVTTRRTTTTSTTTTTTKRPKRRFTTTTTTTAKPKSTTESADEEDETEAPRKFRKSTRKPKRPAVRTRKSLTDRLFIPHTNERSTTSTTVAPTTPKPTTISESSTSDRNGPISATVRIASNRFSTRRSNPYLGSTLKPATLPPASSRSSLQSVSGSLTAPPKRSSDFDEFKENEALNEEINDNPPKSRSSSSSSSLSRRWDGDELFNPFKDIEYEPVRLNSRRNRRSIYNLFVDPSNLRSNYIQ